MATAEERIAQALARTLADYVGDMIAVTETRFEARLRALEARIAALGTPLGAPTTVAARPAP